MRRGITLGFAAALTLTLAACGGDGGTAETGTAETGTTTDQSTETEATTGGEGSLTIWADENRIGALRTAAEQYTEESGIEINLVQVDMENVRTDFLAQVPTGEGPDVTVGAHDWVGEFVANGVAAPIDLGAKAEEFEDIAVQGFTYEGQVYGVPYAIENAALIRNVDIAPDPAPATFDEMIAAGEAAGTEHPFIIQVGEQGDPYTFYPFQTSFGAPVFEQDADGSYTNELAMGGEEGHAFAEWLAQKGSEGILNPNITHDIAKQMFIDGQAPYILGGPWMLTDFEGMNLAVDPIPAPGPEEAKPFVGVQGFYMSARSENQLAAADFLVNYIGSEEVQDLLFEAAHRPPALTASAEKAASDPLVEGFAAIAEGAFPMPPNPEMGAVWNYWGVTEASIMSGQNEPIPAWDAMIADIEGEIGQ